MKATLSLDHANALAIAHMRASRVLIWMRDHTKRKGRRPKAEIEWLGKLSEACVTLDALRQTATIEGRAAK